MDFKHTTNMAKVMAQVSHAHPVQLYNEIQYTVVCMVVKTCPQPMNFISFAIVELVFWL